jgi:hypothetical protein
VDLTPFGPGMGTGPRPWRISRSPWSAWPPLRPKLISPRTRKGSIPGESFSRLCLLISRPSPPGTNVSWNCSRPLKP